MIIHPEILLGLKGKETVTSSEAWNCITKRLDATGTGVYILNEYIIDKLRSDSNPDVTLFFDMLQRNLKNGASSPDMVTDVLGSAITTVSASLEGRKFFRVGSDFFQALLNVNTDLPASSVVGEYMKGYVCIPDVYLKESVLDSLGGSKGVGHENSLRAKGFYYRVLANKEESVTIEYVITTEYSIEPTSWGSDLARFLAGHEQALLGKWWPSLSVQEAQIKLMRHLGSVKEIYTTLLGYGSITVGTGESFSDSSYYGIYNKDFASIVINCVAYINSQKPDLQKSVPESGLTHSRKKELASKGVVMNELTVPVILVSWNYKKPVQYRVDGCFVDSHPRWQPCGPARSQVKLIWVKAHERSFKNNRLEGSIGEKQ